MTRTATKPTTAIAAIPRLDRSAGVPGETKYALHLTVVHEDALTRQWATDVFERVAKVVGLEGVRATWWRVSDLCEPGVLAGAVSTAIRADVVVIAVRAADGLPLPFYVWVKEWLPHRIPSAGALVALLPTPEDDSSRVGRVGQFLRAVALEGRMDFLSEERALTPRR